MTKIDINIKLKELTKSRVAPRSFWFLRERIIGANSSSDFKYFLLKLDSIFKAVLSS